MKFLLEGKEVEVTQVEAQTMKKEAFIRGGKYLRLIKDENLRNLAKQFWLKSPDYFFVIPGSSSGKYHWAKELGGLFDHVCMAMYCAAELALSFGLTQKERDLALVAVAGHDCIKYGIDYDKRYFDMHPFLPRSVFGKQFGEDYSEHDLEVIFSAIERHMGGISDGQWTSVGRIKPETPIEQVVHLADFMASRKHVIMNGFSVPSNMTPDI